MGFDTIEINLVEFIKDILHSQIPNPNPQSRRSPHFCVP